MKFFSGVATLALTYSYPEVVEDIQKQLHFSTRTFSLKVSGTGKYFLRDRDTEAKPVELFNILLQGAAIVVRCLVEAFRLPLFSDKSGIKSDFLSCRVVFSAALGGRRGKSGMVVVVATERFRDGD